MEETCPEARAQAHSPDAEGDDGYGEMVYSSSETINCIDKKGEE